MNQSKLNSSTIKNPLDAFTQGYNEKEDRSQLDQHVKQYLSYLKDPQDFGNLIHTIARCSSKPYKRDHLIQIEQKWSTRANWKAECRTIITEDFLLTFIENCDQLEVIAQCLKFMSSILSEPSLSGIFKNFQNTALFHIDLKIENFHQTNDLDSYFFTDILQKISNDKLNKNQLRKSPNELQQLLVEAIPKISIILNEILLQNPSKMPSIRNCLTSTLLKWIFLLPSNSEQGVIEVSKVINLLVYHCLETGNEYEAEKINDVFQNYFQALRVPWTNKDLIQPQLNMHALFSKLGNSSIEHYFQQYQLDIVGYFLDKNEACTILNNIISTGFTVEINRIIYLIFVQLLELRYFDILSFIYKEFVLKKLLFKLQCKPNLAQTIDTIKLLMFKFCQKIQLGNEGVDAIHRQFMLIKAFGNQADIQIFMDFIFTVSLCKEIMQGISEGCKNKLSEILQYGIDTRNFTKDDALRKSNEDYLYEEKQFINNARPIDNNNPKGLINTGNMCYMNSYIHALFHAKAFRYKSNPNGMLMFSDSYEPLEELNKVFFKLNHNMIYQDFINSKQLKCSLPEPFRSSTEMQDSGEFGRMYLDYLQSFLKDSDSENEIDKLFFGQIENITECQQCNTKYPKAEKMLDIYINFVQDAYVKHRQSYDFLKMLSNSFKVENIDEDNAYFCEKCSKKSKATKHTLVKNLPPYLSITVGRFQYDKAKQEQIKLLEPITIPSSFNLRDIFKTVSASDSQANDLEYELYAFIVHLGSSLNTGHYITYARKTEEQRSKWLLYDDNFVNEQYFSQPDEIIQQFAQSETPYILFYANKKHKSVDLSKYVRVNNDIFQNYQEELQRSRINQQSYFYNK